MRSSVFVFFLCAFMAINFADKAVLGLSAVPIMRELHLSHAQFGAVGSSFFVLFSLSAFVIGRSGDRLNPVWLPAAMALLWTGAQALVLGPGSLAFLVASRVMLGASEGPAAPIALHLAYASVVSAHRPRATAIILAGAPLGTAAAALGCTWIMLRFGWRAAFGALAVISLAWAAAWLLLIVRTRSVSSWERAGSQPAGSFRRLNTGRMIAGATLAAFGCYAVSAIALVWYPKVLESGSGLGTAASGSLLATVWLLQIPFCLFGAWLAEALARRSHDPSAAYGRFAGASVVVCGLSLIGLSVAHSTAFTALCIAVSLIASIALFTVAPPIVAQSASPAQRSSALGAFVAVYALAGFIAPALFGAIVDRAADPPAGYAQALLAAGIAIALMGAVASYLLRPQTARKDVALGSNVA